MFLYQLYNNDLLKQLNNCYVGATVGSVRTSGIAYADDIILMSWSCEGAQTLASMAYNYSRQWRYEYNVNKCSVILFGNADIEPNILLGNKQIPVKPGDKHLGTFLSENKAETHKYWLSHIKSCSMCYTTQGLGSNKFPISPVTSLHIYKQVCIPKLCYGIEVSDIEDRTMHKLCNYHCNMAKTMQFLPTKTANPGALVTLGLSSLEFYVDLSRLLFLWKILLLPLSNIYKRVALLHVLSMV